MNATRIIFPFLLLVSFVVIGRYANFLSPNNWDPDAGLVHSYTREATRKSNSTSSQIQVYSSLGPVASSFFFPYPEKNLFKVSAYFLFGTGAHGAASNLFEIPTGAATNYTIFDFKKIRPVGVIKTRIKGNKELELPIKVLLSIDGVKWGMVANLNPNAEPLLTSLPKEMPARYLKIEYSLSKVPQEEEVILAVDAYDKFGPYGTRPQAHPGRSSLRELLGVNGYWSWGTNVCSGDLPINTGPWKYQTVASHGRNYHDLTWDILEPGQAVDFSKMSTTGTPATEWRGWDREYQAWVAAEMNVQASLQFFRFQPEEWQKPEEDAYQYAFSFVRHFGLTHGNGLVCSIEAGNEPWKYPAELYQKILLGMAKGAREADHTMEVFPCALQAADPSTEHTDVFKNYMGARIKPEVISYLDGINIHAYSYLTIGKGQRRAVHPEHVMSSFWEILNAIRWRDKNMPGKKIYLSEWGWDSDGGGEECIHSECVSENASAKYAIRAALIASRLGIDRATWFFYANDNSESSLYTRSGLTSSKAQGFAKKLNFKALESMLNVAGDLYFDKVIREDEMAWVYQFVDKHGQPAGIFAWRPIDGEIKKETVVFANTPNEISEAVRLDGEQPQGTRINLPKRQLDGYAIRVVSTPTYYKISTK